MSEWIKCSERMPPEHVGVLVTDGYLVTAAEWGPIKYKDGRVVPWWDGHCFSGHEWEFDFSNTSITHWMPLPSPPNS